MLLGRFRIRSVRQSAAPCGLASWTGQQAVEGALKNRQPLCFEQAAGQITIIIEVKHVPYSVVLPRTDTYVRTILYCTFS